MTGRRPGSGWFLDPGCGKASVVVKWQRAEQDLRPLLQPFRPPQASPQSAAQGTGPACPVETSILWDPASLFVIPIPAPLGSLTPS